MKAPFISFETGEQYIDWAGLTDALVAGHSLPKTKITDTFLQRDPDTLLSRVAWIDGLGQIIKTATIFPENAQRNLPTVNGAVCLFDDETGILAATLDFHLVTKWKTAGDSLLAAKLLARPDSDRILIVGAGAVAASMVQAYRSVFDEADIMVWTRDPGKRTAFAKMHDVRFVSDLQAAVETADIICTATMASDPVLAGAWLRTGQHLDLIGAYRPDMREVDDDALRRARLFVDNKDTVLDHIGELKIPLENGTIKRNNVIADFYDLSSFERNKDDITIAKNGGGAHLDLMTCRYILDKAQAAAAT